MSDRGVDLHDANAHLLAENAKLRADLTRLREAGDALADAALDALNLQARIRDLEGALRELRQQSDLSHGTAASTFRSGKWRHMGCAKCDVEEKVDLLLAALEADRPAESKPFCAVSGGSVCYYGDEGEEK